MRIGDLIKIKTCVEQFGPEYLCSCFFCSTNSSGIGVVVSTVPLTKYDFEVMFDAGLHRVDLYDSDEITVISELPA